MLHRPDHLAWPLDRPPDAPLRVLVIDDSRAQRLMLCTLLRRWGHAVVEAGTAEEALEIARDPAIGLVISDWMMPGLTGPEFCRRLRAQRREGYAYVILLTSKTADSALAEGLEAGADDFLTKPVRPPELRARLTAGARIVAMQRALVDRNLRLTDALGEIRSLYDALDRDLEEARRLQRSQMQDRFRRFGPVDVSLWLKTSGHVGGDMVGSFPVGDGMVGVFGLDVSGHGVASAMIAARVAGILSAATPDQNIALTRRRDGSLCPLAPQEAAVRLNQMILSEIRSDRYFTLGLGILDTGSGRMWMVQAGHPHPLMLRRDGRVEFVGPGGLPIGLIEGAAYDGFDIAFGPGDRMLLYSDGLIECPDPDGRALDEAGLARLVTEAARLTGPRFLAALEAGLARHAGTDSFPDDASAVLIDYHGPPG
ncbi:PP2C family protein-serine/threonine phosphatase [Roseicyclus persicicus]|uniref:SpoIIE family protein phosphatase n=1 Tax=Roseicyclus persicicus TaxID=2650661 RepID=A0A7X6JXN1_9RHOB|nr:fused response regulator/phosphatase [Roseibacterium persicicum]NKX44955.1 SpoIIE family protein phosphatase [Roseibacterium persicicum]